MTFNEQWYLQNNPDVAAAVQSGQFASAADHWNLHGQAEGRASSGEGLLSQAAQAPAPAPVNVNGYAQYTGAQPFTEQQAQQKWAEQWASQGRSDLYDTALQKKGAFHFADGTSYLPGVGLVPTEVAAFQTINTAGGGPAQVLSGLDEQGNPTAWSRPVTFQPGVSQQDLAALGMQFTGDLSEKRFAGYDTSAANAHRMGLLNPGWLGVEQTAPVIGVAPGVGGSGGPISGSGPSTAPGFSNHGYSLPSFADPNTAGYNSPMARDQLAFMLNQDTPYMQAAHNAGLQRAAQRGLLNSSLASEAAQKAMVEAAGPIAQQDAQHMQGLREMAEKFGYDTRLDNNREAWATARTEYQSDQQLRADYLKSISNINAQDLNPEDKARAVENLAELYRQSTIRGVMDRISIGENGQISFIQGNTTITPESGSVGQNGGAATSWRNYDTRASMPADLRMQYEARYGTAYEPTQVRWMEGAANDIAYKLSTQGYPVLPPGSAGSVLSQYTGHVFTGANAWPARNAFDQEFQKRAQDVGLSLSNTAALQKVFGWQPPPPDAPYEGGN
jgi:hypothetical protein